jgi:hypothetical protein
LWKMLQWTWKWRHPLGILISPEEALQDHRVVFTFLSTCQTIVYNDCSNLDSHQHYIKDSLFSQLHQHIFYFLIIAILMKHQVICHYGLIFISLTGSDIHNFSYIYWTFICLF